MAAFVGLQPAGLVYSAGWRVEYSAERMAFGRSTGLRRGRGTQVSQRCAHTMQLRSRRAHGLYACQASDQVLASPAATLVLCRRCKQKFDPDNNTDKVCRYHTVHWAGRLNRVEPTETSGLEWMYFCCGATEQDAPGCEVDVHVSYDE
ncbi:hypothetical protein FVE85_2813 [Porphyridium purpureum]|uniref:Uncharacterized protein n=1 Tax=Porphyridium purpureum TaxID=35688 RepID=A0A5J4YUR4_PORPP|nr:hypothetical protein FVE85_2813 [Porphyridium purpureum]|eukprot:POR2923..scf227_4